MSQVSYKSEKHTKKKVLLQNATGAAITVRGGHPVCYDTDYGTASSLEPERATRVQRSVAGELENFAGVVCMEYDGKVIANGDSLQVEIYVPTADGQQVEIWTDQNCTLGSTILTLQSASFIAGGVEEGRPIAMAMQTVDRSSTAGTVQARLQNPVALPQSASVSARSRATTALPTAAIWNGIDLETLRANPFAGSLFETDFTHGEGAPINSYVSATYAASAEGKTLTEYLKVGTEVVGNLDAFVTTDNQVVEWQVPCPITVSGGTAWGFEVRFKLSLITDTKAKMALGLMKPQIMSGDILTDAGAIIDGGFLGLHWKEADGDSIDFVYDETSQTQNEHDDDYIVPVATTYNTFGMYFNGTTIQGYVDGVLTGTAISAVDIAAADFPTAEVLCPTFALKGAAADDVTVSIDWIRVAQMAA